jgi:hypothetical protein
MTHLASSRLLPPQDDQAAAEFRAERCEQVHAAIRAGRTAIKPIGVQRDPDGDLELVNCPHCSTTLARLAVSL